LGGRDFIYHSNRKNPDLKWVNFASNGYGELSPKDWYEFSTYN